MRRHCGFSLAEEFRTFFLAHLNDYYPKHSEKMMTKADGTKVGPRDLYFHELLTKLAVRLLPLPVISEEQKYNWPPTQHDFWVIDPFDGSNNDDMGLPLIGSMVTLIRARKPIFSAIFLPSEERVEKNGFYFAIKQEGAYCWNKETVEKLRVSSLADLNKTSLLLEGRSKKLWKDREVGLLVNATARTRMDIGSAWAFTRLARGKDVLVTALENKPTDNLHGILFAEEAGGRVTDFNDNPPSLENCANLIFSNGLVHDAALRALGEEK